MNRSVWIIDPSIIWLYLTCHTSCTRVESLVRGTSEQLRIRSSRLPFFSRCVSQTRSHRFSSRQTRLTGCSSVSTHNDRRSHREITFYPPTDRYAYQVTMNNLCWVHILKPSNDLVHKELDVLLAQLFGWVYNRPQIACHQRLDEIAVEIKWSLKCCLLECSE